MTYSNELDRLLAYAGFAGAVKGLLRRPRMSDSWTIEYVAKIHAQLETELEQIQRRENEEKLDRTELREWSGR